MPGIEAISGSIKQRNGSRLVFKTYKKPSANRKSKTETRVYVMPRHERSTKLSQNELAARQRFADASYYWKDLNEEQKAAYYKEFRIENYTYRGKKYSTLKGYVIARFYAQDLINFGV